MPVPGQFALYSQETHVYRALAAEIRHDPIAFSSLLRDVCDLDAGDLIVVGLEQARNANVDLVLRTNSGATIGIEAKFDHEVTLEQLQQEKYTVDKLVLLVLSHQDVPPHVRTLVDGVLTWEDTVAAFRDSRLTEADVELIASHGSKSTLTRPFQTVLEAGEAGLGADMVADGWRTVSEYGNSGRPAILIESPMWEDGRRLLARIEGDHQRMALARRRVQATVGVTLFADEQEMPLGHEPGWAGPLKVLALLWDAVDKDSPVRPLENKAQGATDETVRKAIESGKGEVYIEGRRRSQRKIDLADQAGIPLMYVKGSGDSCIGMKSVKSPEAELPALYAALLSYLRDWWTAVDGR